MIVSQVNLSEGAHEFIEEQLSTGQFSSPDEVISKTLEEAREQQARKKLMALLQEGLDSGPGIVVTEEWRGSSVPSSWRSYRQEQRNDPSACALF